MITEKTKSISGLRLDRDAFLGVPRVHICVRCGLFVVGVRPSLVTCPLVQAASASLRLAEGPHDARRKDEEVSRSRRSGRLHRIGCLVAGVFLPRAVLSEYVKHRRVSFSR